METIWTEYNAGVFKSYVKDKAKVDAVIVRDVPGAMAAAYANMYLRERMAKLLDDLGGLASAW